MVERQIKLTAKEDVKEFVNEASKCDFDIDIFYNRVVIDAKSILGVLSGSDSGPDCKMQRTG